jgi:hypothetical protein
MGNPLIQRFQYSTASMSKAKAGALHVSGFVPHREEGKIAGFFKAFK